MPPLHPPLLLSTPLPPLLPLPTLFLPPPHLPPPSSPGLVLWLSAFKTDPFSESVLLIVETFASVPFSRRRQLVLILGFLRGTLFVSEWLCQVGIQWVTENRICLANAINSTRQIYRPKCESLPGKEKNIFIHKGERKQIVSL